MQKHPNERACHTCAFIKIHFSEYPCTKLCIYFNETEFPKELARFTENELFKRKLNTCTQSFVFNIISPVIKQLHDGVSQSKQHFLQDFNIITAGVSLKSRFIEIHLYKHTSELTSFGIQAQKRILTWPRTCLSNHTGSCTNKSNEAQGSIISSSNTEIWKTPFANSPNSYERITHHL